MLSYNFRQGPVTVKVMVSMLGESWYAVTTMLGSVMLDDFSTAQEAIAWAEDCGYFVANRGAWL